VVDENMKVESFFHLNLQYFSFCTIPQLKKPWLSPKKTDLPTMETEEDFDVWYRMMKLIMDLKYHLKARKALLLTQLQLETLPVKMYPYCAS
jgi:hypothetical protein